MTRAELVPTTAGHCARFFPAPLPFRIRAITALKGDEILGIGGLAFPPGGTAVFLEASEANCRRYPILLHKAARRVLAMARELGVVTIFTTADISRAAAEPYLARLGFTKSKEDVWTWAHSPWSAQA